MPSFNSWGMGPQQGPTGFRQPSAYTPRPPPQGMGGAGGWGGQGLGGMVGGPQQMGAPAGFPLRAQQIAQGQMAQQGMGPGGPPPPPMQPMQPQPYAPQPAGMGQPGPVHQGSLGSLQQEAQQRAMAHPQMAQGGLGQAMMNQGLAGPMSGASPEAQAMGQRFLAQRQLQGRPDVDPRQPMQRPAGLLGMLQQRRL